MKNKVYEDFSNEKINENSNFNAIIFKVKERKNMKKFKILNLVASLLIIITICFATQTIYAGIQWNIQFKEYQNREYECGYATITDATETGYIEDIKMDYITQNNIAVKVDSLLIVNDYLEVKINFKLPENIKIDSENFSYGFAIYDENKNIYGIVPRTHIDNNKSFINYTKSMYKELGVKYDKYDIFSVQLNGGAGIENLSAKDYNIISKITMNGLRNFPKTNKLFVRIFDLGFYTYNEDEIYDKDFLVSDSEWIFELNIPEKFYELNNIELALKDELSVITLQKITVDDIRMKVELEIEGYEDYIIGKDADTINKIINITDAEGNIYYSVSGRSNGNNTLDYFAINKNMLDKSLFLNVQLNDKIYTSELIQK